MARTKAKAKLSSKQLASIKPRRRECASVPAGYIHPEGGGKCRK